jgi:hypothetical protein
MISYRNSDDTTKWEMQLGSTTTTLTEEYLSENPMVELEENVMINASFFANACSS